MTTRTRNRILTLAFLLFFVPAIAVIVIRLAQGYRPDLDTLQLQARGLLVATSEPDGAQVFINDKLATATNNTLNLTPGNYRVEIKKDGYHPWQKTYPIEKELVFKTEAQLFPAFPDLKPLTFTGASRPIISPDGQKVVFSVGDASAGKNGLWVLELSNLPLGFNREPRLIAKSAPRGRDYATARYSWSPDSKQILATLQNRPGQSPEETVEENFLLDPQKLNPETDLIDITQQLDLIRATWEEEKLIRDEAKISKLPDKLLEALEGSVSQISFSPDETKILYTATASATLADEIISPLPAANPQPESRQLQPGKIYVYDLKEDRNFFIIDEKDLPEEDKETEQTSEIEETKEASSASNLILSTSTPKVLSWFPTSRHLFLVKDGKVTIMEYDNTNQTNVYTGPLENAFAFPFPDGSKLLILTSLGSQTPPNLYAVNLR